MKNKKYIMCLECGNVQVRTDIETLIDNHYIVLSKPQIICKKCMSTRHIATNNIRSLRISLEKKAKEDQSTLEQKILYLVK